MIATLCFIALVFLALMKETGWLRIRLLVGADKPPKYARYKVYNSLTAKKYYHDSIHNGDNYPADYSPNGEPEYNIVLNPGIDNVLCGWEWLNAHVADCVDYKPEVFMNIGNVRYTMLIKQPSIIKDVMRVNHLTKKQVQAL